MLSYVDQVAISGSVRKTIERAVAQSADKGIRAKINDIPTTESVLRAVSVRPDIDTIEKLKDFTIEHILNSLRLTEIQREHLDLRGETRQALGDFLSTGPKAGLTQGI
jgi:hypothetical protein